MEGESLSPLQVGKQGREERSFVQGHAVSKRAVGSSGNWDSQQEASGAGGGKQLPTPLASLLLSSDSSVLLFLTQQSRSARRSRGSRHQQGCCPRPPSSGAGAASLLCHLLPSRFRQRAASVIQTLLYHSFQTLHVRHLCSPGHGEKTADPSQQAFLYLIFFQKRQLLGFFFSLDWGFNSRLILLCAHS